MSDKLYTLEDAHCRTRFILENVIDALACKRRRDKSPGGQQAGMDPSLSYVPTSVLLDLKRSLELAMDERSVEYTLKALHEGGQ